MFGPLIEKYLLANKHRVTVELLPDQQLAAKEDEAEKAELAAFKKKLVDSELQEVIKSTQQLKERQVCRLAFPTACCPVFCHSSLCPLPFVLYDSSLSYPRDLLSFPHSSP